MRPNRAAGGRISRRIHNGAARAVVVVVVALAGAGMASASSHRPNPAASTRELQELIGERFVVGFYGTSAPGSLLSMIHQRQVAGVILYSRNISSRSQLSSLVGRLQKARPRGDPPLIVSIDQEGGLVKRLDGAPTMSAAQMGANGSASEAESQGYSTAQNLRGVGVNVNLAPVLDVARPGTIMAQTQRSFGGDAALVSRVGVAFAQGLAKGGVAATAKHFPGLGDATANEDDQINEIRLSRATLRSVDEAPFRAAAGAGIPLVMVSTARYPSLGRRAAIFSHNIAELELRDAVHFKGVAITDDLDTPAAQHFGPPGKRGLGSVEAGCDLLLYAKYPRDPLRAAAVLLHAARTGEISLATLRSSAARIKELRAHLVQG